MIRVGRCIYSGGARIDPELKGYESIIVLTKSSEYGSLGPYELKDKKGRIMENIWQFSKVYEDVPKTTQMHPAAKYNKRFRFPIWECNAETHLKEDEPTNKYWRWRKKGMNSEYAIRYPVGFNHRHKCKYALIKRGGKKLDYIESRKKIYSPLYKKLVKRQPQFKELLNKLKKGKKLLIIEVDGPHNESLRYYQQTYGVKNDFIEENTMVANRENLDIMLNDEKHPYGHGYCLADALLEEFSKK